MMKIENLFYSYIILEHIYKNLSIKFIKNISNN